MKKIIRLTENDLIKLVKRVIKEQNLPLSNDLKSLQDATQKQNIDRRIGADLFNKLDRLAKSKGMTFNNSPNDGTYFIWTKKLIDKYNPNSNSVLVLVAYNRYYEPKYGGVTTYIDQDGGNAIKFETGKILEGTPKNGTYPNINQLDQIGLNLESDIIISNLTENINYYLSKFGLS